LAGYDLGAGLGKFAACCQLAAFQLLVAVLGGFQLLLQLRPHGRQGGLAGLDILQFGIDFRDSGLSVGNGAGQGIHGFLQLGDPIRHLAETVLGQRGESLSQGGDGGHGGAKSLKFLRGQA